MFTNRDTFRIHACELIIAYFNLVFEAASYGLQEDLPVRRILRLCIEINFAVFFAKSNKVILFFATQLIRDTAIILTAFNLVGAGRARIY